jgi:predicted aconitase
LQSNGADWILAGDIVVIRRGVSITMKLRDEEKRMLGGERGPTIQKAMQYLVDIGEGNGAEEMVDISRAHVLTVWGAPHWLPEVLRELTDGEKVRVPTTTHSKPVCLQHAQRMGMSEPAIEETSKYISDMEQLFNDIGAIPTYTCLPDPWHHLKLGDHVAFTDTLVVPLANAWFGARTNMESPLSAVICAITGKTPKYGMHLAENRVGEVLVEVAPELKAENFDNADYGALSYWAGKIRVDGVSVLPVYNGLSPRFSLTNAKNMCLSLTWNSKADMFHVVGVTPEAPTIEAALGGREVKSEARLVFGRRELKAAYEELTSATEKKVDVVSIGCPHCTLEEIIEVARLIDGRKIHMDTQLWVGMSAAAREIADRMGLIDVIEQAGGSVMTDSCVAFHPIFALQPRVIATNVAALYKLPTLTGKHITVWYGTAADCMNAAVKGRWEV